MLDVRKTSFAGNHSSFMNKELSKAIMKRSRLRSKFFANKSPGNSQNFNKSVTTVYASYKNQKGNIIATLMKRMLQITKPFGKLSNLFSRVKQ